MHLYIPVLPTPLHPDLAPQSGAGKWSEAGEELVFRECGVDEESHRLHAFLWLELLSFVLQLYLFFGHKKLVMIILMS
jgi:hypothetical protein